jgi:hypothetical protein
LHPAAPLSKAAAGLDSSLLFIAATTGVVGLAAFIFLFVSMIRLAQGRFRTIYLASVAAVAVHSLFVNSLFYPWVMVWLWVLTGLVTYDT